MKYTVWIAVALLFTGMDLFSEMHPWNEDHLEGATDVVSSLCFLFALPVSLPAIFVLSAPGLVFNVWFIGSSSIFNEPMQLVAMGLTDLFICFVYFAAFQAARRGWNALIAKLHLGTLNNVSSSSLSS